jgi:hypothetical protein
MSARPVRLASAPSCTFAQLLAYQGEVVNVDHGSIGNGSWNPWGFTRGTDVPMIGIDDMEGKERGWQIMSYEFFNSIRPVPASRYDREVEVKVGFAVSRMGVQKYVSLWVHIWQNPDGFGDKYLGTVRGGTLIGKKYRFNNAARRLFAAMPAQNIPSFALLDEGDDDEWIDALMKTLDVYKKRDERTWSFRPSVRDSGRE